MEKVNPFVTIELVSCWTVKTGSHCDSLKFTWSEKASGGRTVSPSSIISAYQDALSKWGKVTNQQGGWEGWLRKEKDFFFFLRNFSSKLKLRENVIPLPLRQRWFIGFFRYYFPLTKLPHDLVTFLTVFPKHFFSSSYKLVHIGVPLMLIQVLLSCSILSRHPGYSCAPKRE